MSICENNIFKARTFRKMSQKEVAGSLHVSAPTVSDWERQRKYPAIENLKQLADLFNVSTDYLLCRTLDPSLISAPSDEWQSLNLVELRKQRQESPEYVAESIGIPIPLYLQYEAEEAEPTLARLVHLADHFGVDVDFLLCRTWGLVDSSDKFVTADFHTSRDEQHLLECFRRAPDNVKESIITLLDTCTKNTTTPGENPAEVAV